MDDMLTLGKQVLALQPFSVLLGAQLTAFSEGNAELKILIKEELKQQHGFLHGGVISYAADNALTYAVNDDKENLCATAQGTITKIGQKQK